VAGHVVAPSTYSHATLPREDRCSGESLGRGADRPHERIPVCPGQGYKSRRIHLDARKGSRGLIEALEFDRLGEKRPGYGRLAVVGRKPNVLSRPFMQSSRVLKSHASIFSSMSDTVLTGEAAARLGTTAPTVRSLIERGLLTGRQEQRGARFVWLVEVSSIDAYLREHGEFTRRRGQSRLGKLEAEVTALRAAIGAQDPVPPALNSFADAERERDDLRATIVMLREMLVRAHSVAELQCEAEAERAVMIEHLQAAAGSGERADALRRQAVSELQEALAAASRPGHLGGAHAGRS